MNSPDGSRATGAGARHFRPRAAERARVARVEQERRQPGPEYVLAMPPVFAGLIPGAVIVREPRWHQTLCDDPDQVVFSLPTSELRSGIRFLSEDL